MANKIEIFENSLLRLLVRRGTEADRRGALLAQGELGYTTDTKKLYVGDGSTVGGVLIGNTFAGSTNDVTSLNNVSIGDLAYDSDGKFLYRLKAVPSTILSNWERIGGIYSADNDTILLSEDNVFSLGAIPASKIDPSIAGNSLTFTSGVLDVNKNSVRTNALEPHSVEYFTLPSKLKINNVNYQWPNAGLEQDLYLSTGVDGVLQWKRPVSSSTLFVPGTAGQIPVGSIMPVASNGSTPAGWLLCNGQTVAAATYPVLFQAIGTTYGGDSVNFKLPDLINKSIYGVATSPSTSTIYSLCARTTSTSTLSAAGMLYVIKALADPIVQSNITFGPGLSSTLNNVTSTGLQVTPLSGNHIVSLEQITTTQLVSSNFYIDDYGRVTGVEAVDTSVPAGVETVVGQNAVYNVSSNICYFKTPITIYTHASESGALFPSTADTSFRGTISAFPVITQIPTATIAEGTAATPTSTVPINAKGLIIESRVTKQLDDTTISTAPRRARLIVSAPALSSLEAINSEFTGSNEYTISYTRGHWAFQTTIANQEIAECAVNQVFLPLRLTTIGSNNYLTASFRSPPSRNDAVVIRVVGYTL